MTYSAPKREAAVRVYRLSEADRAWLMDKLTDSERDQLQNALEQLKALGIPNDPQVLDELLGQAADELAMLEQQHEQDDAERRHEIEQIDGASSLLVARLLEREPPWVIRVVLDYHDWRWKAAVIEQLKERFNGTPSLSMDAHAVNPYVKERVIDALVHCIENDERNEVEPFEEIFLEMGRRPERPKTYRSWWRRLWPR